MDLVVEDDGREERVVDRVNKVIVGSGYSLTVESRCHIHILQVIHRNHSCDGEVGCIAGSDCDLGHHHFHYHHHHHWAYVMDGGDDEIELDCC